LRFSEHPEGVAKHVGS